MKILLRFVAFGALLSSQYGAATITMNSKYDPLPPYTALDPHTFLLECTKWRLRGWVPDNSCDSRISFNAAAYGQNARKGRDATNSFSEGSPTSSEETRSTELGDLNGKWNMITLLFGPLPEGATLPPLLAAARAALFPDIPIDTPITDTKYVDVAQKVGFFSIPASYKKKGVRFQWMAQVYKSLGLVLEAGVADICFTPLQYNNLTCETDSVCGALSCSGDSCHNIEMDPDATGPFSKKNVNVYLMNELKNIAPEIGLDIYPYHQVSLEDIRLQGYWRHAYPVNCFCPDWPGLLVIPFVTVGGTIAASKDRNLHKAWSLSAGNDGHNSVGFSAGINFDFIATIEIGAEAGITHFFKKEFCNYRVPTNRCQSGIYPFSTSVIVEPGDNTYFSLKLSAYHFLDNLSFYFQYQIVQHRDDKICLKNPDPAFLPEKLERTSTWKSQMANVAFNYDISPNISLGFLWQAPLSQRNAPRSTTVLFSFNVTY